MLASDPKQIWWMTRTAWPKDNFRRKVDVTEELKMKLKAKRDDGRPRETMEDNRGRAHILPPEAKSKAKAGRPLKAPRLAPGP